MSAGIAKKTFLCYTICQIPCSRGIADMPGYALAGKPRPALRMTRNRLHCLAASAGMKERSTQMKPPYQTYLDNLAAAQNLVKPGLDLDISAEEGLRIIRDNAERLFRIHQENDKILDEILFSKEAGALTQEEAAQLGELAKALFNYNRSPDTGVAYRIHRLLYDYAQFHQNLDLMIEELYHQGITLMYLNVRNSEEGVNLFVDQIGAYFRAGASYLDRYEEIQDPKTRSFILRCLGNTKYGLKSFQGGNDGKKYNLNDSWTEYSECFDRAMDIFQSPYYRRMNPDIPWDTYVYTMHYDRTQFLSGLRSEPNPVIAKAVLESAEHVYRHQEQIAKAGEKAVGIRTQYVYAAARYHSGQVSLDELMDTLFGICEAADLHDFSGDNIWTILYAPGYLLSYSRRLSEEKLCKIQPRLQRAIEKQKEYLFLLPNNEHRLQVSRSMSQLAGTLSAHESHRLLDYILACHPPTFVHSQMVALLARRLCAQMAKAAPELLEGAFGIPRPEGEGLETLLDLVYHSGLYHDLGKCMLLNCVGLYSRRLLDEEFACIKLHTFFGCSLLKALDMEDISNVAYCHHRAYDGASGYPRSDKACPSHIRRIVDIITVVDCLDAGTDNVGRSYAASKTYEQLVEELRAGRDTRYAPEVVALFDDPVFYRETKRFLHDSRRQVYLNIYYGSQDSDLVVS